MSKKTITIFLFTATIFVSLIGYNYLVAQKKIRETRPSPLGISLQSFPQTVVRGQSGSFLWSIDSSPDLSTSKTAIYWGNDSSPSALTKEDSPEAVGYAHHTEDYTNGIFKLPDVFDVNIKFDEPGKVYFRAFAKVGDNYLWTEENTINVTTNK